MTFNVWIPASIAGITGLEPFAMQGAAGNWGWSNSWYAPSQLKLGAWNTLTVQLPANSAALAQLGVQFTTSAAWTSIRIQSTFLLGAPGLDLTLPRPESGRRLRTENAISHAPSRRCRGATSGSIVWSSRSIPGGGC